jgi:predicted permease
MSLFLSILASDILPVFLIAGAGFLLARYAAADVKILARVVFYSLLPCLAFRLLVSSNASGPNVIRLMLLAASSWPRWHLSVTPPPRRCAWMASFCELS